MTEQPTTILVVDDSEALRYTLVRALQSGGYRVMEAMNGNQALQLAMSLPDLITLDIRLPDIDGYEVCRRLRSLPQTRHIPVLHISANFIAPEHKVKALEGGADGYLAEPINKDELLATVRALLRMKHAEEEARGRERELRVLADSIPHIVWIADANGAITYFNVRWFEFTGIAASDSMPSNWMDIVHPDDRDRIEGLWQKSLNSGVPFQGEARYRNARGEYRWMSLRALCIEHDSLNKPRWVGTSTDIEDEKRKEQILRQTERMALAGRMAASIAHEINNPLESITNIFYLLESDRSINERSMALVRTGNSELGRVSHIVRQSLSYYRNSNTPTEVDLADLVDETIRVLNHHLEANRVVALRRYESHDKVRVFVTEIRQVFSNLILNAIEAMPKGGKIVVKVRASRDWRNGNSAGIRVSIGDSGTGVPMADRSRVFDPFFTTKLEKGTGLGLWVSNEIIQKHGGQISIRSRVDNGKSGTVFSVFLPTLH